MNFEKLHPEIIKNAKHVYFGMWNVVDDNTRRHILVRARAAFTAAFRPYCRAVDLAAALGKHHSSIVHYTKIHDGQMLYGDYRTMYDSARELLATYVGEPSGGMNSLESILHELNEANKKVEELLKYKYRYDEIVARVKELA
jgi:aminopeptidase-like protein